MSRKTVRHGWVPIALAVLCLTTTLASPASAAPGDQLWIKGFAGSRQHDDRATAMAISPDGRTVFVTGEQDALESSTIAYEARSGILLWAVHNDAVAFTIVAANGRRVFVAGMILDGSDFFTMALDADTGALRWSRRYHGPNGSAAAPSGIALSPDGGSVFVTGPLSLSNGNVKGGTVAYNARDGATLWSARWDGPAPGERTAKIVAADTRVFVSATSAGGTRGNDYTTIAYDAATGTQLWTRLYDGAGTGTWRKGSRSDPEAPASSSQVRAMREATATT
jgi:outer membrane protein assembly factor BamB